MQATKLSRKALRTPGRFPPNLAYFLSKPKGLPSKNLQQFSKRAAWMVLPPLFLAYWGVGLVGERTKKGLAFPNSVRPVHSTPWAFCEDCVSSLPAVDTKLTPAGPLATPANSAEMASAFGLRGGVSEARGSSQAI